MDCLRRVDDGARQRHSGGSALDFGRLGDARRVRFCPGHSARQDARPRAHRRSVLGDEPREVRQRIDRDVIRQRAGVSRAETESPLRFEDSLRQIDSQRIDARHSVGDRHSDLRAIEIDRVDS